MIKMKNMKKSRTQKCKSKPACSTDEAIKLFKNGEVDLIKAAEMCGLTLRYFMRSANIAGVSTYKYDKDGKPMLVKSEKILKRNSVKKNVSLDEKAALARRLGVSYGQLSAMLKMEGQ